MPQLTERPWYDPASLAARAQLDVETIRYYIRTGRLRATKFGRVWRIAPEDADAFLASGAPPVDPEHQAAVERWLANAPPLSERQRDAIAAAFGGDDDG